MGPIFAEPLRVNRDSDFSNNNKKELIIIAEMKKDWFDATILFGH